MYRDSLISRTGQSWKLYVLLAVLLLSFGTLCLGFYLWGSASPQLYFGTSVLATCAGLGGFAYACNSVRCSRCGLKWLWVGVSQKHYRAWGLWLAKLTQCPQCGYSGGADE